MDKVIQFALSLIEDELNDFFALEVSSFEKYEPFLLKSDEPVIRKTKSFQAYFIDISTDEPDSRIL